MKAATPASSTKSGTPLVLDGLGKDAAPLDGPWQFHMGDDPTWANPNLDDSQWEQLTADKPWGVQGHQSYQGYAWYRRSISITPAPGAPPDFTLLIPAIDDVYEIYWNGALVGHVGSMPPNLVELISIPAQTFGLGPVRTGVLAVRVFKTPLGSNEDGKAGGFEDLPLLGSADAIAAAKGAMDFRWLRGRQFVFGLTSLYALVGLLSLFAWLRDRKQWLLFWMTVFAFTPLIDMVLVGLRLPYSNAVLAGLGQVSIQIREISQWFVLLWLLQLHESPKLARFIRIAAIVCLTGGTLDGLLFFLYPNVLGIIAYQITDAVFTALILPWEVVPAILVTYAVLHRQRLDSARWVVASIAFLNAMVYWVQNVTIQGVRFTHWTLAERMNSPMFSLNGNPINALLAIRTLLFLSIVYAVVRYLIESRRRTAVLEREFQNARELQQVLVPETLPAVPGFTLTSAYRPAQEVGGDFFQIIPLDGGSTLVILGDVSGKGLKAAMAVSLIVGAVRALADSHPSPADLLAQLNRRLYGRLQGGFATCVILRISANSECTVASAGHPAPFINDRELTLPGALPLGLSFEAEYEESTFNLKVGDHFALYTDGLLEARSQTGELYSFARLQTLFATNPNAAQATEAAVNFGQDDDITVLTLTRLATGQESTATHTIPVLTPA
jgi:hypothetical protein